MTANELLASVTPWVQSLAVKYARKHGLERDDVFQAAVVMVLAAAHRYDPAKGRPSTWASFLVRGAVSRLLFERTRFGRAALIPAEILADHPTRADADDHPHAEHLGPALAELSDRQRGVIDLRYGLGDHDPHTLAEVGERFGFTKERARQVGTAATKKLRTAILARAHPAT